MEEIDSDDEDIFVPLGHAQGQGQGLDKLLPIPYGLPHGGASSSGDKCLYSSCSIPYNTVFDDQYSGLPADSARFPSSLLNLNASYGASFDSMALLRSGE